MNVEVGLNYIVGVFCGVCWMTGFEVWRRI